VARKTWARLAAIEPLAPLPRLAFRTTPRGLSLSLDWGYPDSGLAILISPGGATAWHRFSREASGEAARTGEDRGGSPGFDEAGAIRAQEGFVHAFAGILAGRAPLQGRLAAVARGGLGRRMHESHGAVLLAGDGAPSIAWDQLHESERLAWDLAACVASAGPPGEGLTARCFDAYSLEIRGFNDRVSHGLRLVPLAQLPAATARAWQQAVEALAPGGRFPAD
jgi:hypothetical protein